MLEKITNEDIKYMAKKCVSMIFEHVGDNYDSSCSYIFCKNEDGSWCILCGRRGNTAFSGRNLYNPPMGMKEFGETAVQCAVRECEEETGLSLPENLFKFVNSEEYGDGKMGANFVVVLDGVVEQYQTGNGDGENSKFEWIPVNYINNLQWAFNTNRTAIEIFEKYVHENEVQSLSEHSNMKTLYHFTSIYSLREIVNSDELLGANYLKDYWDNNSHISLTRHKSNFEGFAFANGRNYNVRIQFNIEKLNSKHDVLDIKPMEFYSPKRHGKYTFDFDNPNGSSKAYYHSPKNRDENGIEYHNQAEEGLQIKNDKYRPKLKNIHKYIDRIDILFKEFNEVLKDYEGWNNVLSEYQEIGDSAFANYVPIFVYTNARNFALQDKHCVKLKDMLEFLNNTYGNIKDIHGKRFEKFLGSLNDLEEGTLNEHTNMKSLYHFTTLSKFISIACTNRLTAANYCNSYWDNNDHISLTRHKSDLEGFANASFPQNHSVVRLEIDTDKLNSRHTVLNVKPMEYYSPNRERHDAVNGHNIEQGKSGKERYQDKDYYYKRQELGGTKNLRGKFNRFARLEYQNQAEEGLQVKKNMDVKYISNCVNRVDIYYPNLQEALMGFKNYANDFHSFSHVLTTDFGKKVPIYMYDDRKHFILQDNNCKELKEVVEMVNPTENLNEDIEKNFIPTPQWMKEKYDELNESLFMGRLGECGFNVFTTGRGSGGSVLGWFKITGYGIKIERRNGKMFRENYWDREYINKNNFVDLCKPVIELNGNYTGTEHGFMSTLVHEMCHYYTYMDGWAPKQAHGREFREIGYIVAARSNGMFTVQRIASAEQMSELELNDEMKAKRQQRLERKKASVNAIIVYRKTGHIELTISSNKMLISTIQQSAERNKEKFYVSNDAEVIEFLFGKGYRKNMRTWRFWYLEGKSWLKELEALIESDGNDNMEEEPVDVPHEPKKIFTIKTNSGTFECEADGNLINSIKERFPKMNDDTINKIINNPANYKIVENKKDTKDIIKEVIDEFIANESVGMNNDDCVSITPDMNLGTFSPLQIQ